MFALILAAIGDPATVSSVELSPFVISILIGTVVPILTGLATKLHASDSTKAIVALVMSIIAGTITAVVKIDPITWQAVVTCAGAAFAANVVSYKGAWSVIGGPHVPGALIAPDKGIGQAVPPPTP